MATSFHERFDTRVMPAAERAFGVSVVLRSGTDDSEAFTATFDMQEFDSIEFETGLNVKLIARDYLLPVADCVIDSVAVDPVAGMYIVEGSRLFEILPIPGRPAAELQSAGNYWLVHTKEVA